MSSEVDEMLEQFKQHQRELETATQEDEDDENTSVDEVEASDSTTESDSESESESGSWETPEPTAKPLTNAKPIKPDRSSDDNSRQERWKQSSLTDDSDGVTRSKSGRLYYYTPVKRNRNFAENRRKTDVPAWMFTKAKTKLYAAGHSPVFHADRECSELQRAREEQIRTYPIRFVVTRDVNPNRPCPNCTLDIENTVRVAIEYDSVDPDDVVYPTEPEVAD